MHITLIKNTLDTVSVSEKTGHSLEQDEIVSEFFHAFMHENALNPMIFPALRYSYN